MPNVRAHVRGTNRLLQLLPEKDRTRVLSNTEHCVQGHRDEVFQRYSPIKKVHFPLDGVISLIIEMKNGTSAEVGVVGNEGMAGLPLLTGSSAGSVLPSTRPVIVHVGAGVQKGNRTPGVVRANPAQILARLLQSSRGAL